MNLNELTTISPIDGRYRGKTESLTAYFSEFGLIQYRVKVEIEYVIFLNQQALYGFETPLSESQIKDLRTIYTLFSEIDASEIKTIEKTTNHDVKAVEYFIKEKLDKLQLSAIKEWVHFGLTSQDINNTAIPLSLKDALNNEILPQLEATLKIIENKALEYKEVPMLARTHGQAASPTRMGKELMVFAQRLSVQLGHLKHIPFSAKFGGATGNFNAHNVAFPNISWQTFGDNFVNTVLGLHRSNPTTQIEHYDNLAALCDCFKRLNTILIDFSRDIWQYIAMDYFKQKLKEGEIGSSAMPHKVNPIDFENAEGNLGLANAIFEHLAAKLPISRLQRDLTDSTVLRNIGVPFAHCLIAYSSLQKGIGKLIINESAIQKDLDNNWVVVAEAIQTVLRTTGYPNPYEALKGLTRTNAHIGEQEIKNFIESLDVSNEIKSRLLEITPSNYLGN
ncbi:MAG: adenylosuccinate lyase [Bacteroidetes bacterium]|nr:adenylosuccinate lyase [Bacteroidota bacterium]